MDLQDLFKTWIAIFILNEASFNTLTEERYLELIDDYENPNEDNKANFVKRRKKKLKQ